MSLNSQLNNNNFDLVSSKRDMMNRIYEILNELTKYKMKNKDILSQLNVKNSKYNDIKLELDNTKNELKNINKILNQKIL